jgi:hypothetical protein
MKFKQKPDDVEAQEQSTKIRDVIKDLSPSDFYNLPFIIKSLCKKESLDRDMSKPVSVMNIFGTFLCNLKNFDVDKEIADLGAIFMKLNVDHLYRYRDMIVQNIPYDSTYSLNHITYKIMGYDHDQFGPEYKKVYLAMLQFLENYYQTIGDYEYAEQASKDLGHWERYEEFHKKMIELIERGEYNELKSFDVSTEDGRRFIRESGLTEEIDEIVKLSKQTPIENVDYDVFVNDLKARIISKASFIKEELEKVSN